MIHLYHGSGKGKTTAAMGLCLRMAGHGRTVVVAQFMKGPDSGERTVLSQLPGIRLLEVPAQVKFSFLLSPDEQAAEQRRYLSVVEQLRTCCVPADGLVVLDEVCDAVNAGLLPLDGLLSLLDCLDCEVVLTGRNPERVLVERADYITRFEKERHPYDQGVPAREGVEF